MTRQFKLALLATVVAAVVTSARAQASYNSDLIVGFSDGTHNDVVYDLGPESTITNGETWKLGSTGLNIMGNMTLTITYWGVIGDNETTHSVWTTTDGSFTPRDVTGHGDLIDNIEDPTESIYANMSAAGVGNYFTIAPANADNPQWPSWNEETVNPFLGESYGDAYEDPNALGATNDFFYGLQGYDTDPVLLGSFTLAANFVLTYNTNSVSSPPPSPVASFSGTPTNLFVTQSVAFTNTSANSFTNSVWSFGDGNMATNTTGANVTNTYATAGTYTVSLTVSGTGGSNMATSNNYVVVKPIPGIGKPVLSLTNFIFSGTNGVPGVQYRIVSTNNLTVALSNWPTVFTGTFHSDGSYNYTNSPATNTARFFRLVSP
jgi:hypothetical protein